MSEQPSGATPPTLPGWAPAPAPKWNRPSGKVIAAVVVLIVVGVPFIAFMTWRTLRDQLDERLIGPVDGANHYLAAVKANDPDTGFRLLCTRFRSQIGEPLYRQRWADWSAQLGLLSYRVGPSNARINGHPELRTVQITLQTTSGLYHVTGDLQKEGGEWHWCGLARMGDASRVPMP